MGLFMSYAMRQRRSPLSWPSSPMSIRSLTHLLFDFIIFTKASKRHLFWNKKTNGVIKIKHVLHWTVIKKTLQYPASSRGPSFSGTLIIYCSPKRVACIVSSTQTQHAQRAVIESDRMLAKNISRRITRP